MTQTNLMRTVLLVEDDEAFRYAVGRYLRANGYTVIDVAGSMAALDAIDKGGIDLVVADVGLNPKEPHGVALARMIHNRHPRMHILFVTGMMDIGELESELPGELLFKPVELTVLSAKGGRIAGGTMPPQLAASFIRQWRGGVPRRMASANIRPMTLTEIKPAVFPLWDAAAMIWGPDRK